MVRLDPISVWRHYSGPQIQGRLIREGGRCALGVLVGEEANEDNSAAQWLTQNLEEVWGIRMQSKVPIYCPLCNRLDNSGSSMIIHLNDYHRFTFAQIADFVEQHSELFFVA